MRYNCKQNEALKQELRSKHIRYREIAEILHYSEKSITAWLSKSLDNKKELAIRNAIAQIVERRRHQVPYVPQTK